MNLLVMSEIQMTYERKFLIVTLNLNRRFFRFIRDNFDQHGPIL